MKKQSNFLNYFLAILLTITITLTVVAGILTYAVRKYGLFMPVDTSSGKLNAINAMIQERYIGDADQTAMEDAAAKAMVAATGDRWSHYFTASEYQSYLEQAQNAYVGVGITIQIEEGIAGLQIMSVVEGGPAEAAGVLAGDVLIAIDKTDCTSMNLDDAKNLVRGEEGTTVTLTVLRDGKELELPVARKRFETPVATAKLLSSGYGLITIENFEERCAEQTIAAVKDMIAQVAKGLIFDVRFNPGGYQTELVKVLDYLLPEGILFQTEDYTGKKDVDYSDAAHIDLPMAVLVNEDSYSAAEFFAAALQEYEAGVIVGTKTFGKGYFQTTYPMTDGSALMLSIGKYYTPKGRNLADVGVTPDVAVAVEDETLAAIYYGTMDSEADPQILAAVDALNSGNQS